jgi:hypothetical protein
MPLWWRLYAPLDEVPYVFPVVVVTGVVAVVDEAGVVVIVVVPGVAGVTVVPGVTGGIVVPAVVGFTVVPGVVGGTVETGVDAAVAVARGAWGAGAGLLLQAPENKTINIEIINIEDKILFFIIVLLVSIIYFIIKKEKSKDNHSMLSPITSSTGIEKTIPLASLLRP